jgi:tRNA U55 pseudouridine synthase TruB
MPVDALLADLPRIDLPDEAGRRVAKGQPVAADVGTPGPTRLYAFGGRFLGLGESTQEGVVIPKRMVSLALEAV